jgi:hypothetical protein
MSAALFASLPCPTAELPGFERGASVANGASPDALAVSTPATRPASL